MRTYRACICMHIYVPLHASKPHGKPIMPTIATATREEIANALNTSERECQFCGKAYTPRTHWQSFCSAKCRTAHHNEAGTREIERLQAQVSALKRQVVELQEELARRGCVEE